MNQTIRSRIEQIKRGEIPEGYEKTPFGIFPYDWEKSTLKKLGEFAKGKGIPGEKMKNEGIPCVGYGDIYMKYNYHFNQAKSFIDRTTADESIQVGRNTLLFTGTGETAEEIGKCVCYTGPDDIYVGGDIIIFNSVEVSPVFIAYQQYLPFAIKQKAGFGQGYSVVHIYKSDLEKLYCAYPKSKAEQEKIAEILQEQDRLIELKEKLTEEKKKQKQYLMEVLLTGKVRLPGFTDEWESTTLGDIAKMYQPQTLTQEEINLHAGYPVYGANGVIGFYEKFNHFEPQIIITCRGSTCGTVLLTVPKSWINGNAMVINVDSNKSVNKLFMYYLFSSIDFSPIISGSGQPQIVRSPLSKWGIKIPKIEEQEKISKILKEADEEIKLLETELEEQKRKKQSLMQLLLTGIVRVKA